MPTRKWTDPPMLRPEHYASYMTHPSQQTSHPQQRFLHGHPAQGTVLSRPSKRVNIHQIRQRLVELQEKQKEQFDRAHRAKDLHPLKIKEQVQFFRNKQGTGPIKWMTGTVTEILECGQSYMIQAPNSRVYRRNRASLEAHMSQWLLLSKPYG